MQNIVKTKICNVTTHYHPIVGGQEVYIQNLNKILLRNGFQPNVLQRYVKNKGKEANVYFTSPLLRYLQFLLKYIIQNSEWFTFKLGLFFSKSFLKSQDILICHYPFLYPPIKWHKKIIIVSHGVLWSNNPKTIFDVSHKKISLGLKNKDVFIVANDTHFLREIGYNIEPNQNPFSELQKNIWFIPNCINTTLFTRDKTITKEKIILLPRNIRPDRGIHLAIESFNIFIKNNEDFKMIIIGSGHGNPKYFNYCKELVLKYNLTNKIVFLGHASQDDMIRYYNKSMVTLIPSLEKEGTSLSALESMSCGTATIVTSVAGLLDLPAFKTDLDANSIAISLEYVINHNSDISSAQQKIVRNNFNLELWERCWLKVINNINNI